ESVSVPIRNIVELVVTTKKSKDYITNIKSQFALSFEEIYIIQFMTGFLYISKVINF
ncbi:hypothetical protein HZY95_03345, partial [Staphylococcus sciuri]|nr:hypothetical protein [Mammaliicoccus sciuri]NYS37530.1 hypothetical protein [Mammaliicoccus sciuri]